MDHSEASRRVGSDAISSGCRVGLRLRLSKDGEINKGQSRNAPHAPSEERRKTSDSNHGLQPQFSSVGSPATRAGSGDLGSVCYPDSTALAKSMGGGPRPPD